VPVVPGVTEAWLAVTPPTVMLLAGIAAAGRPCASMMIDVGAVPMKLKVVLSAAAPVTAL